MYPISSKVPAAFGRVWAPSSWTRGFGRLMAHHLYFLVDAHRAKWRGAEAATDVLWHPNLNLPTHWRASLALLLL
jgi:hypothetical protein